jgi:hypothetical protein
VAAFFATFLRGPGVFLAGVFLTFFRAAAFFFAGFFFVVARLVVFFADFFLPPAFFETFFDVLLFDDEAEDRALDREPDVFRAGFFFANAIGLRAGERRRVRDLRPLAALGRGRTVARDARFVKAEPRGPRQALNPAYC